jgi:biopolymer transport protein ExbD
LIQFNIEESIVEKRRGPDLMPLIDMVFILLIFFLLTSTAALPSVDVELPETSAGETKSPPSIAVTIQADGTLLIDEQPVPMDQFLPKLESLYREQSKAELTIRADRRVSFGKVVEIMDLSKRAGAAEVSFLVEVEESKK